MKERRKSPRFAFGLTGLLHRPGETVGSKVIVHIISATGCAVDGAPQHSVGKECELYFDWSGLHVGAVAEVASRDSTGRLGLKFKSLDREMQSRLQQICDALRERALAVGSQKQAESAVPLADSLHAAKPPATPRKTSAAAPAPKKPERRKVPRYVGDIPARISNPATGTDTEVTLIVLSILGCCLEGETLPAPGQTCELTADWEGKPLVARGEVMWNTQGRRIGLKFSELDPASEKTLRQICSNLRLQPMGALPPEP
jgi:hypothetical protein